MGDAELMKSGVCAVSVDSLEGRLVYRVLTVYLASRDLHASRVTRTHSYTDPGRAVEEVAMFVYGYQQEADSSCDEI